MGLFLYNRKQILAHSADGTYPILRDILKCSSGSDAAVRITYLRIIDIAAWIA